MREKGREAEEGIEKGGEEQRMQRGERKMESGRRVVREEKRVDKGKGEERMT